MFVVERCYILIGDVVNCCMHLLKFIKFYT